MRSLKNILQALAVMAGLFAFGNGLALAADGKDLALRGDAKCTGCHDENDKYPVLSIAQTRHGVKADGRTPTCTSCHGASDSHVSDPMKTRPDRVFAKAGKFGTDDMAGACLDCHESGNRTHWAGSRHQADGVVCSSCHTVHAPRDRTLARGTQSETCFNCHKAERAQTHRISTHPIDAGKVACSDCHNPHGSAAPKNLVKATVNETCFQCHAEKRGPFLWEHASVTDDCMNCHTPHGSTNPPLLRARAPYLCQECHGDGAPHPGNVYSGASLPGGRVANVNNTGGVSGANQLGVVNPLTGQRVTQNNPPSQLAFRSCVNCHNAIHGSNHPAGNRFLR